MRSWSVVAAVLLCQPLALVAQTAAQRALNNEPESKQIQSMSRDMQTPQQYPPGDPRRQSQVGKAVENTSSIRQMSGMLDQLEDRLNHEARACNFCPEKQEELSELIRQRVETTEMTSQILGHDRAPFMMKLAGITPDQSRWTNIRIAYSEASDAVRGALCAVQWSAGRVLQG